MQTNIKEELLKKVEELSNSEDVQKAFNEIKKLGKNFRSFEETSFYDQELNDKYDELLAKVSNKVTATVGDVKTRKTELINQAKQLLESNQFKSASNKMKQIIDDYKQAGHLNKEEDDALWQEFNNVKQAFFDKKNEYYDKLIKSFEDNKLAKSQVIEKAKQALESNDIPSVNKVMNDLMDQWKKIGSAGKQNENELWDSFKSIRNDFYKKRDAYYDSMKSVYEDRAKQKQEIIAKAKINLAKSEFSETEINDMNNLKNQWKQIGHAGKDNENELWEKFKTIINKYNENMKYYK